jgi:hypothetical protein
MEAGVTVQSVRPKSVCVDLGTPKEKASPTAHAGAPSMLPTNIGLTQKMLASQSATD